MKLNWLRILTIIGIFGRSLLMNKYEKLDWLNEKFQTKFGLINLTNKPDEKLGYYVLVRCEICKNHKN